MKTYLALALTLLSPNFIFAQKDAEPPAHRWLPEAMINIHDSVAVYLTGNGKEGDKNEHSIAIIDTKGVETGPEIPLPKNVFGIALFHGELLAFYQPALKGENREVRVIQVDLVHGKTGEDKTVYSVSTPYTTDFHVERDKDEQFQGLLARTSALKSKKEDVDFLNSRKQRDYDLSTALSLTTLSPTLETHLVNLTTQATTGKFLAARMNGAGELFTVTGAVGTIVAEKYNPGETTPRKLSETFLVHDNDSEDFVAHLDGLTGEALTLAVHYSKTRRTAAETAYRFDFAADKVYTAQEDVLDKDYYRALKADTTQVAKVHSSNVRFIENLVPVSIVETQDYVAVCKEIQRIYTTTSTGGGMNTTIVHYLCEAAILSVYDRQMNLLHSITIDKSLDTYIASYPGINIHLDGDKLYAITTELSGAATFTEYAYTIDLQTGAFDKKKLRKSSWAKGSVSHPMYTFWLKDGLVANYVWEMKFFGTKIRTSFFPAEYE